MSAADTFWQLPNTTPGSRMDRAKQAAKRAIARTTTTVAESVEDGSPNSAARSNFRGDLRQQVIESEKKQRIAESRARRQERRGNGGFKAAAKELLPGIATDLMMEVVYAPSEMAWRKEMGQTESQAAGGALAGSIGSVGGAALGGLLGSRIARATGGKPGGFRSSMFGLAGSFGGQMIGQNLFAAAADRASGAQQTMMQAQLEQMQQMQQPRIANSTSGIDPVENPYLTIGSWY